MNITLPNNKTIATDQTSNENNMNTTSTTAYRQFTSVNFSAILHGEHHNILTMSCNGKTQTMEFAITEDVLDYLKAKSVAAHAKGFILRFNLYIPFHKSNLRAFAAIKEWNQNNYDEVKAEDASYNRNRIVGQRRTYVHQFRFQTFDNSVTKKELLGDLQELMNAYHIDEN